MHIDRCYCFEVPFLDLKHIAETHGLDSVEALQAHHVFGENCNLCHPYIRRMIRTGQTEFGQIVTEADEPVAVPGPTEQRYG